MEWAELFISMSKYIKENFIMEKLKDMESSYQARIEEKLKVTGREEKLKENVSKFFLMEQLLEENLKRA